MTQSATISADYTLRPSELAPVLALLVEARQATIVWGPPGAAKSMIAQQVAAAANRQYVDVRALLLDPVDLRGIPWRDGADRTRWAPPAFLPPSDDPGRWLINLEELPSAVPMVQAALYQLVLDRRVGEYFATSPARRARRRSRLIASPGSSVRRSNRRRTRQPTGRCARWPRRPASPRRRCRRSRKPTASARTAGGTSSSRTTRPSPRSSPISSACMSIHRPMRWCCRSTRSRRSKHSTAPSPACR